MANTDSTYTSTTQNGGGGGAAAADAANPFNATAPFDVNTGSVEDNTFAPGMARRIGTTVEGTQNAADYMKHALKDKSPQEIKALQQQLADAGYSVVPSGLVDANTLTAYEQMLSDVHLANLSGNPLTPEEYLAHKARNGPDDGTGDGSHTETATSFTPQADARATAEQVFAAELGKRPTQKQLNAFYAALHTYEAAHPSVTSTEKNGNDYSTTSSGGAGTPDAFAQQYVDSTYGHEAGSVDALHYFDIVANTLGGPPGAHQVV